MPFQKGHTLNKGIKQSPEHIEKLRQTRIGRKWTQEQHEKMRGRKWTKSQREKMEGRKWTESQRKKIIEKNSGENHYNWSGDEVGYRGIHHWVEKTLGKPDECEMCGTKNSNRFHWCSKTHEYKRDVEDWIRLCPPCHGKYDKENNLRYV